MIDNKPVELIVHTSYFSTKKKERYRATLIGLGYEDTQTIAIGVSICSSNPDKETGKIDVFSRKKGRDDARDMAQKYPLLVERVIIPEEPTDIEDYSLIFKEACLKKLLMIARDIESNIRRYKELKVASRKRRNKGHSPAPFNSHFARSDSASGY